MICNKVSLIFELKSFIDSNNFSTGDEFFNDFKVVLIALIHFLILIHKVFFCLFGT